MNRVIKILLCLPAVVLSFLIISAALYADESREIVTYKIKSGIEAYLNGDLEQAIDDFKKALLLEPSNEKVKGYLAELGAGGTLSQRDNESDPVRMARVAKMLKDYQQRIAVLEVKDSSKSKKLMKMQEELNEVINKPNISEEWLRKRLQQLDEEDE